MNRDLLKLRLKAQAMRRSKDDFGLFKLWEASLDQLAAIQDEDQRTEFRDELDAIEAELERRASSP